MIITDFLEKNARILPDEIALVEVNPALQPSKSVTWREYNLIEAATGGKYRREMSWKEFDVKACKFANLLKTRGFKKGDKVAILLMNCLEWLPIYFGILKAGCIVVPMNYRYTSEEILYCLKLADASCLVMGPEFIGRIEQIHSKLGFVNTIFYEGNDLPRFAEPLEDYICFCSSTTPPVEIDEEDYAAIYFSSGTTGFPKAILHKHTSLVSACITEQKHHMQKRDDVFLCIPPLYHTGAKMHWFGSLLSGSKAILLRGVSPEWVLRTVSDEKVSIVWLLVPWAQDILDAIESGEVKLEDYDLSRWRLMHIGAQPVPPSLIQRWKQYFPNHDYDTNYGLSESIGPGCVHLGIENIHKVGAIGKPGYNWEAKIVDEKDNEVGVNEAGELIVKGPGLMTCYYKNEEATNEVLRNGWLYTGDMAIKDEDDFIFLVDRKKDVIISGGENIYPVQIEDFLRKNSKIKDSAVIGTPDKRVGEIATAIVELKDGETMSEEEFNEFCLELPKYKRPRQVIFDKVPRNPTGKIEKPKLREKYGVVGLVAKETLAYGDKN
ncbi:MAG: AMP-binding protein [Christensenellaceae bacterium]|nr:AMP-binding protein [Christensenellaceae bacterium]